MKNYTNVCNSWMFPNFFTYFWQIDFTLVFNGNLTGDFFFFFLWSPKLFFLPVCCEISHSAFKGKFAENVISAKYYSWIYMISVTKITFSPFVGPSKRRRQERKTKHLTIDWTLVTQIWWVRHAYWFGLIVSYWIFCCVWNWTSFSLVIWWLNVCGYGISSL